MELRQLAYFVAVAEARSFTRAAEQCAVVQSALSQQIRRLEVELGVQLFTRTTRSVTLTQAGATLLDGAHRILSEVGRVQAEIDAISGLVRGRVSLGSIQFLPVIDLPRLLAEFHRRYPNVDVVLRTHENEQMLAEVRSGALDLAFVSLGSASGPADGLSKLAVLAEPLLAVVPARHTLASTEPVSLAALAAEPFIELGPGSGLRAQAEQAFAQARLARHIAFEVGDLDDMLALSMHGMGVALLPRSLVHARGVDRPDSPLRALPVAGAPLTRRVALVWREREPASPAARALLGLVKTHVG